MEFSCQSMRVLTMRTFRGIVLWISCVICSYAHAATPADKRADGKLLLRENWRLQPSTQVRGDGKAISTPGYRTVDWYSATVPSTVLAALVEEQVFLDPYYGLNLRSLPGATNPIGREDFMVRPMPPESPFRSSWWYRTEFRIPPDFQDKTVWLHFGGVNYRSNVWLNGRQVASAAEMTGTWRTFEFDV